jgi:hypothetical protein
MYHKYNLHTKNTKNKNKLKSLLSSMLKLRSAQSHMLLFVFCLFFQPTEFGYYIVMQCILIGSRLVLVICFQKWSYFF